MHYKGNKGWEKGKIVFNSTIRGRYFPVVLGEGIEVWVTH